MAQRLEQVEVVVAPGRVAAATSRLDVVHLQLGAARAAVLARFLIALAGPIARVAPEVVVDEVGTAAVAAPSTAAGGERVPAPRTLAIGISGGFGA